jgi:sodium/proline symporter
MLECALPPEAALLESPLNAATLTAFLVYLLVLFGIAIVAWHRTRNVTDYALGGRSLGPAVAALSAGASDMSGWLLLGLPGAVYLSGIVEAWIVVGLVAGAWLNWLVVAAPLRRATAAEAVGGGALTLPEFLVRRFGVDAHPGVVRGLRLASTLLILFFFTFYVASGLVAGARLFESSLGLDYLLALFVGGGVIVAYTVAGGFLAVAWTDFFQGLLMLGALVAVPVALATLPQTQPLSAAALDPWAGLSPLAWLSLVAWGLGYFGQPHILARFMAIESAAAVPRARRIGMSWMILSCLASVAVGLGGRTWFGTPLAEPETVFIALTQVLFHPLVAGVVLAAILAAVMSTIDSQLLVASTALAEDVYRPLIRPDASATELVQVGRIAVLCVAGVALALALDPDSLVLSLVSYAWAGLGASFGPVILLALHWRPLTAIGALAGMVTGGVTVVLWGELDGGLFDVYELLPGFLAGTLAAVLASRATRVG